MLVEAETEQGTDRLVRRYFKNHNQESVRLVAASSAHPELILESDQMIVLGVVCGRLRFEPVDDNSVRVIEEPLETTTA